MWRGCRIFRTACGATETNQEALSFLKIVTRGGDFLGAEAGERLNDALLLLGSRARVVKGFGMTELCSTAVTCTTDHNPPGSVGRPLPFNEACAVVGRTVGESEAEPATFVVLRGSLDNQQIVRSVLLETCAEELAECAIPAEISFVGQLPLTAAGKVDYRALERMALDGLGA